MMWTGKLVLPLSLLLATRSLLMAEPTVETVIQGLQNPVAVVLQPETDVIFVAESGAGRVIRIVDGKAEVVITGFPLEKYGDGPQYRLRQLLQSTIQTPTTTGIPESTTTQSPRA